MTDGPIKKLDIFISDFNKKEQSELVSENLYEMGNKSKQCDFFIFVWQSLHINRLRPINSINFIIHLTVNQRLKLTIREIPDRFRNR